MTSFVAIDWSGRKGHKGRTTWMAVVENGTITRLENEWSPVGLVAELKGMRHGTDHLIVGLDFAFSFPANYVRDKGWISVRDVWRAAKVSGETWLASGEAYPEFWGRVPKPPKADHDEYRRTELVLRARGFQPKSIFQTGGAGSVGTGAIRGMALLDGLSDAGFAIWPFDNPADRNVVVEIYPRLLTGPVVKTSVKACLRHLETYRTELPELLRGIAAATEEAVSAIEMWRHRGELEELSRVDDSDLLLEGYIWAPPKPQPRETSGELV